MSLTLTSTWAARQQEQWGTTEELRRRHTLCHRYLLHKHHSSRRSMRLGLTQQQ